MGAESQSALACGSRGWRVRAVPELLIAAVAPTQQGEERLSRPQRGHGGLISDSQDQQCSLGRGFLLWLRPDSGVMPGDRDGFAAGRIRTAASWDCMRCPHTATGEKASQGIGVCSGSLPSCLGGGQRCPCVGGVSSDLGSGILGPRNLTAIPYPCPLPASGEHPNTKREKFLGTR